MGRSAGYHIGAMYERFWRAVTGAPVPESTIALRTSGERQLLAEEYRARLQKKVRRC